MEEQRYCWSCRITVWPVARYRDTPMTFQWYSRRPGWLLQLYLWWLMCYWWLQLSSGFWRSTSVPWKDAGTLSKRVRPNYSGPVVLTDVWEPVKPYITTSRLRCRIRQGTVVRGFVTRNEEHPQWEADLVVYEGPLLPRADGTAYYAQSEKDEHDDDRFYEWRYNSYPPGRNVYVMLDYCLPT